MRVLIDAGHGIDTLGKRSPDGVFREYLWNREIAEMLMELFEWDGIDADMVVTETNDIPLKTRVRRVNEVCALHGAGNVLLLSIHANAAGDGSSWMNAQGWSCYTTKGKTNSDKVAEELYKVFEEDFKDRKIRRDFSDGDADWEEDFYLIKKASCPAVLLENFFYDNKEECSWMMQSQSKSRIAMAIYKGVKSWIQSRA